MSCCVRGELKAGLRFLMVTLFAVFLTSPSLAHRSNESYVYFNVADDSLSGRFEVTLPDLDKLLQVDANEDGEVQESELNEAGPKIFEYLSKRLSVEIEGKTIGLEPTDIKLLDAGQVGVFAQIGFDTIGVENVPEELRIHYAPLTDVNSNHAGFILIDSNTRTGVEENEAFVSLTFDEGDPFKTLSLVGEPWMKVFVDFVIHGVWHIWLGFDHVIFLITLLLPSVMIALNRKWAPEEEFGSAFWNVVKIVTAFTLSHSVTLALAALGIVSLPASFVEAVIAASIIIVALMNIAPSLHRHMLLVVLAFGLFHGFGFANVLAPLPIDPTRKVVGLAAFNIGVELGQIAIVIVVFPILWLLRRWALYPFMAFRLGTLVLVLIAGMWLIERTTDYNFNVRAAVKTLTGVQL